jgi:hypothetical protein
VIDESEKLPKSAESFAAVDGDVALLIEGLAESILLAETLRERGFLWFD